MLKKYEHIFFDLDRTLWHFDENSKKVLNDIFSIFNLNRYISSSERFITKYQEVNEQLWADYRDDKVNKEQLRWKRFADTLSYFSINDIELSKKIGEYYIDHSPKQTLLFPHTIPVLDYLCEKYQLHIITNGFQEVQYVKLSQSGILKYFKEIILSEKVGVKKPHPFIFKKAFELSGANADNAIMIGDDLYADIYGAQRMKMDHIYFNYYKLEHNKTVYREINCLSELYTIL